MMIVRLRTLARALSRGLTSTSVLLLLALAACTSTLPNAGEKSSTVTVIVTASEDSKPLPDARAFILSMDGRTLSEGKTDATGVVILRKPAQNEQPAYLLAEHQNFFLGGSRWRQERDEYYLVLALGAVR